MGKIIGIDLGTTNSCAAVVEVMAPRVLANREGSRTTAVDRRLHRRRRSPGRPDRQAAGDHQSAEYRLRGQATDRPQVSRTPTSSAPATMLPYTLVEAPNGDVKVAHPRRAPTARRRFLRSSCARSRSSPRRSLGEPVTEAIITVPAYFNDSQRQATKDAGTHRRPRGAAHHQRAHRRGPRLRPRPAPGHQDDRGLRPGRRHLRHLDPRARRRASSRSSRPRATPTWAARTSTSGSWTG